MITDQIQTVQKKMEIKMNGEYYITGPKFIFLTSILQNQLKPVTAQGHQNKVGIGAYFSDKLQITKDYPREVAIGTQKFRVALMSRCRPGSIRSSESMQKSNVFVINNTDDIRSYRFLLYELA